MGHTQNSGPPLGKIIAVVSVVLLLVMLGVGWVLDKKEREANHKEAQTLYARAMDEFEAGNFSLALEAIDQALRFEETPLYLELKYESLLALDRPWEAEVVLADLIDLEPKNPHFHYEAGLLASQSAKHQLAYDHFTEASALEPKNIEYKLYAAQMLLNMGRSQESIRMYQEALKQDPNNHACWEYLGGAYYYSNQLKNSLALRKEAVKTFPTDPVHWYWLGREYDNQKMKDEAVKAYRRSLELQPLKHSLAAQRIYQLTGKRVEPELEGLSAQKIDFHYRNNRMYIYAIVNGIEGAFLFDTGAEASLVWQGRSQRYKLGDRPVFAVSEIQGVTGVVHAPVVYSDVQIGAHRFPNTRLVLAPDPKHRDADGIIGMDIMKHFNFSIDRDNGEIILQQ